VSTHGQAAGHFNEQHTEIAIVTRGRIEDRAGHDIVAARFEHQRLTHPVVITQEKLAFFSHADIGQDRRTARDDTDRVAACMGIDTNEGVGIHVRLQVRKNG
jgi:hypothetical protein